MPSKMRLLDEETIRDFEAVIQYRFNDVNLLEQSLLHSSYANENNIEKFANNERLEFLGDAVLEIITSSYLFNKYPEMLEGELTKLRASIVCEPTLASFAKKIELGDFILLGKGEENSGGRGRASVLSDTVEAIIGAIYLDGGLQKAEAFVSEMFLKQLDRSKLFVDSKTHLQELIQKFSDQPVQYEILDESGPDHNKIFKVSVSHMNEIIGLGSGRSKKSAEQEAAYNAIKNMEI